VCHALRKRQEDYRFSVSCTTRDPREGEEGGVDYHFLDREEFERRVRNGEFAEFEEVHGHFYGTLKSTIEEAIARGEVLLVDIDVKGALNLKRLYKDRCLTIFLDPPSLDELKDRLRGRDTESQEQVDTRIQRLEMELEYGKHFDLEFINDKLDETVSRVHQAIERKRHDLREEITHGS